MGLIMQEGKFVSRDEVTRIDTPCSTDTWRPVSHIDVIETVTEVVRAHNWEIEGEKFGLAREGQKMFGVMEISRSSGIIWRYTSTSGLWLRVSAEELNNLIAKTARDYDVTCGIGGLVTKINEPTCNHIRKFMKDAEKDLFKDRPRTLIHVGNGMVEARDDGTCILKPFSPDYYSRNQCNIEYNPDAQCPRFLSELLEPMLPENDIETLQLYCGQCLLGINFYQKLLLLTGTPGGGKGTLVSIIRAIVGEANSVELRTEHLGERFELARFIGKTLLIGSDVPSDFLLK